MSLRILTLILCLSCVGVAFADWYPLNDTREPADAQVNVLSSTNTETKLEITIPGYHMDFVKAGTQTCVMVNIPGAVWTNEKAHPTLPVMAELVRINNLCCAKLEVISKEEIEVELPAPIVPSKGQVTRNIDPETLAFEFGPVYHQNIFYINPEKQFSLGEEFILRDVRGVRLSVVPITANHVTMKMKVLKKAVVVIKMEGVGETNLFRAMATEAPAPAFDELYKGAFLNYNPVRSRNMPEENNKKLVVVVASDFESLVGNWVEWKKSKGFTVTVKTVKNESADAIKSYLQNLYNTDKFGYVVLVGDIDRVPTLRGKKEQALADRVYVRLAGNDNYPDAFISRISGNTAEEITTQLNKVVAYEKTPKAGSWFRQGVTIASDEGSPKDSERAKWLINGGGQGEKTPVLPGGLKSTKFGTFAEIYDPGASASKVADALNNMGGGIICYIGHGSTTSWGTTGFSNTNIKQLRNGEMLPVIWSVACVNGKFDARECFAEAWLRQPNGGAIAVEAASTNEEWVPPTTKQIATVNAYISNSHKTFGALECVGCVDGLKKWGDGDSTSGNMMAEQCNLFGDCTMEVYYPKKTDLVDGE